MVRFVIAVLLMWSPALANASKMRDKHSPCALPYDVERLQKHPPFITPARLPRGMHIGRCLLEVDGTRRISGTCAYHIEKDGSFEIDGTRQIYGGIDYPDCLAGAAIFTTDYFASVEWINQKELDDGSPGPGWELFWNETIGSNQGNAFLGPVNRHGACYSNDRAKICLWKK